MALQKSFTTAHGFTTESAYARITSFSGNKDTIQVLVEVHKDAQARTDEKQPIETFSISLPLAHGATMEQMYTALKLDSNFTNAIDC
jgi:hypothetical protein